jgi:GT2 family glycosyltransferase
VQKRPRAPDLRIVTRAGAHNHQSHAHRTFPSLSFYFDPSSPPLPRQSSSSTRARGAHLTLKRQVAQRNGDANIRLREGGRANLSDNRRKLNKRSDIHGISILVPTYRDMHLLSKSLPIFLDYESEDMEVLILNNDPSQDIEGWLDRDFDIRRRKKVRVVEMGYDSGFGRAVNRGIALSRGELLFICNADFFPSRTYVQMMRDFFEQHARTGLAIGKILRYDLDADAPTDIIDTAGLIFSRNRRFLARGEGYLDVGQFAEEQQVFGVDGAAVTARRAALDSIAIDTEYFDENFFMYKEDWDISWRVRLMGWECWYVPRAIAYHARTSRGLGETRYLSAIRAFHENEREKPAVVRFHSLKNQWLMLVKNEDFGNFWRDLPFILSRELMVLGYNLVFSPRTLLAVADFAKVLPSTLAKRRFIKSRQTVSARELRGWLGRSKPPRLSTPK